MKRHYHYNKNRAGFTTVELLVALTVCSIVLTAVASLAYALGSAGRSTDEISAHQMALRCATVRITDLVKHSVMAFATPDSEIALWTGDDNNDGLINGSELVYVLTTAESLRLLDFPGQNLSVTIDNIETGVAKTTLVSNTDERYMTILPECSNVQFNLTDGTFVSILLDLTENGITSTYQICTRLRCSAQHLLNSAGQLDGGGDDD
jgi:type II secretory pathway pseudopilin PulG